MEYKQKIVDSTVEIFTSMIMMEVESIDKEVGERSHLQHSISGVIGLAGAFKGVLAIHLPKELAMQITGNFLGMDVEEINEDVEDAIGEIANMLGGDVKGFLTTSGSDIDLSLPSTISGEEYEFQAKKNAVTYIVPFKCGDYEFTVELQLEK